MTCFQNENERALASFLFLCRSERLGIFFDFEGGTARPRVRGDGFQFRDSEATTLELAAALIGKYRDRRGLGELISEAALGEIRASAPTLDSWKAVQQVVESLTEEHDAKNLDLIDRGYFLSRVAHEAVNLGLISAEFSHSESVMGNDAPN